MPEAGCSTGRAVGTGGDLFPCEKSGNTEKKCGSGKIMKGIFLKGKLKTTTTK